MGNSIWMGLGRLAGILICCIKIALVLLSFFSIASCSSEKKQTDNERSGEGSLALVNGNSESYEILGGYVFAIPEEEHINIGEHITFEPCNLFAVVKTDNAIMHWRMFGEGSFGYIHKGTVISIQGTTSERILVNGTLDYFYQFQYVSRDDRPGQWIHGRHLDIISIPNNPETVLLNAVKINHEIFPEILPYSRNYLAPDVFSGFIDDMNDWIILDDSWKNYHINGFIMRFSNMPFNYNIAIYANGKTNPYIISAVKWEYSYADYERYLSEETRNILSRILPLYEYYHSVPITLPAGRHRTEIRSKTHDLLYSTSLDYFETPFRIYHLSWSYKRINNLNFYLLSRPVKPFYLVVYGSKDIQADLVPVAAFAIYPNDDIWEGLLTFDVELSNLYDHRFFICNINQENNYDFSNMVEVYIDGYSGRTHD